MGITSFIIAAVIVAAAAIAREVLIRRSERNKAVEGDELLSRLRIELKRADRFNYHVALVVLDFEGSFSVKSIIRAFNEVVPDQEIKKEVREYDLILRMNPNLLFLVLPFQSNIFIESVLESRISKLAAERKWKNLKMAVAIYPEDADAAEAVRDLCLRKLQESEAL